MALSNAVSYGAAVIVSVGAMVGGIAAIKNLLISDIQTQISGLEDSIPSKVKEGVRDALVEDKVVRIEVNAIIDDQLARLIDTNNKVIADLRAEMAEGRESLTKAIRDQTTQLSRDIRELKVEMSKVRSTQNILLQRLGVDVPRDPKTYWEKGLWRDAPYNLAPVWIIERGDYDLLEHADTEKKFLLLEAVQRPQR